MNEHAMPTDEELSAAIDGEADPELLARIEASPEARARLHAMRAAAELVGDAAVDPLGDDDVDALIAGALDAPVAPVRPASARGRTPWLVAASVVLLMAVGLTLIWAGRGSDSDQASSAANTGASEQFDKAADSAPTDRTPAEMAPSTDAGTGTASGAPATTVAPAFTAGGGTLFLGSYADGDALREATATSFAAASELSATRTTSADAAPPADAAISRCAEQLKVTLSQKAAPTASAYALVDGKVVLVYEFATTSLADGSDTTLVAAVGADACQQVVIFER